MNIQKLLQKTVKDLERKDWYGDYDDYQEAMELCDVLKGKIDDYQFELYCPATHERRELCDCYACKSAQIEENEEFEYQCAKERGEVF